EDGREELPDLRVVVYDGDALLTHGGGGRGRARGGRPLVRAVARKLRTAPRYRALKPVKAAAGAARGRGAPPATRLPRPPSRSPSAPPRRPAPAAPPRSRSRRAGPAASSPPGRRRGRP